MSDAQVSEIERALGRELPSEYREFSMTYGGAFVGGLVDGTEDLPILHFFGADPGASIFDKMAAYDDLVSDGGLPVARCELGNIYVLARANSVHYVNYYGGRTTARKVADGFADFVARIVVIDE
ncbi:SMI1/KNR4 family protein [Brevundimonas sp. FT23042]|uniref:SMI1/KNR4 family protein n=1 Tax=Brevundimonas sp. FT23042 TaxID=3393749 RepID=UPI003B588722